MTSDEAVREVTFANGAMTLAGSVMYPRTSEARVPGVVLIGGSGAADRHNDGYLLPVRQRLVDAGLAVLAYDKRGVGSSTGDWRKATLGDLAKDAAAALEFLCRQPDVHADAVGLFGHSEGGWVALRAGAGRDDLAWVITSGCPGVSPAEQERYELASLLHTTHPNPPPQQALDERLALYDSLVRAGRRGADFAEVTRLIESAGNPSWVAGLWGRMDECLWELLKRKQDHDPIRDALRLRCRHLAVFGAADPVVPVTKSIRTFTAAVGSVDRHPLATLTVEVFPEADHRVQVKGGSQFAPGYLSTVVRWIEG
ncbi:alpha/beta hydrolase family protein [Streptomyces zagrosensis]|uniref:Serine aminopeptidase S33 domain-containing protein n=1 Tax=Streptomyces zagrosensis TaxID=1042984 RepID=A0A7W9V107_9ACTN|nr:alpha/beta hydrolase [Streptomyces zagrosensis]MBB5938778.1 hypothetical protein [Streptomyces zagrosensis]